MFDFAFAFTSTHAECIKCVANILLSVDVPVLPYYRLLYAATHFFQSLVTLKNYFSNIYASMAYMTTLFTYNYAALLNTIRDPQVISDCRGPETARTTCVYKCIEYKLVVLLKSFDQSRQMKKS